MLFLKINIILINVAKVNIISIGKFNGAKKNSIFILAVNPNTTRMKFIFTTGKYFIEVNTFLLSKAFNN